MNIRKGEEFAEFLGSLNSPSMGSIGGFGGSVSLPTYRYKAPRLVSTTDGVGTKLLVAMKLARFDTVGIDLVAMNVNDLIACGAEPISFLDYIAVHEVDRSLLDPLVRGILTGCQQADCTLAGGETAEMPDLYPKGHFDLAGFCTGLVEENEMLPKLEEMKKGDRLYGLPSSGIHSNGLSLARKAAPEDDHKLWELMLEPTKIYVREIRSLLKTGGLLGIAHITGGGIPGNLPRILPKHLEYRLEGSWEIPEIFERLRAAGQIDQKEMERVFNMGIGMILVVKQQEASRIEKTAKQEAIPLIHLGELVHG
ncbi:MAG: phosphoribosylformylglycinamidine cyclo-ligase [Spirochaetales bacterium]|nr:phosphoribosylformylglycinamidine cyclo-ligase [Spirochaetales bacterium]MCF7938633.1 phosphoribosylformylglycinamidine cyclo-ligase [Spirochaetales bacterium]